MKLIHSILLSAVSLLSTSIHDVGAQHCNLYQIYDWTALPQNVQNAVMELGSNQETWDSWGKSPVTFLSFDQITGNETSFETPAGNFTKPDNILDLLQDLALYNPNSENPGICWDFFINHYGGYSWSEIGEKQNPFGDNIQELVTILGWTEDMWDANETLGGDVPESECMLWVELAPEERWVLRKLGWYSLSWRYTECDPRCPRSLACPNN